ncbi:Gfo/Idh/MocA family oxidoreductase [Tropicimonas sp. TH_r6]|uniref:Gfo/Idh/MocA family protein n=1 Tax=Tropicimonas sp. TH_r6 TaxID=3082085 RepID=UPI0029551C1D|nr:Gfo/Idh/MocA family oxidoreductase [Tropicimonas sp. TH_r6]MDV7143338.1 Gfo/Idh/MocA family oxidoreductase [Tropicimonas sp. TH_r6]
MPEIGIGMLGGGYMGKAHSAAMAAVGTIFETNLKPRLEMIGEANMELAEKYRQAFGYNRCTDDWRALVDDPAIGAIIIATPQRFHREIAEYAFAAGKHVLCEKPMGASLEDSEAMVAAAEKSGLINQVAYCYSRSPATQYARKLMQEGAIGDITWFRGEHTEDFFADVNEPWAWRCQGLANGCLGDLAVHLFNGALALMGPVDEVMTELQTVHPKRPGGEVTNDDQVHMMCRFGNGAIGHMHSSRVATGRKMGYCYEIHGTKGAIKFDQEDQNSIYLYRMDDPEAERGYRRILTGPAHPDYKPFCLGPGHGTGYHDMIVIESKDFLEAIDSGTPKWPTFRDGLDVARIVHAAVASHEAKSWQKV